MSANFFLYLYFSNGLLACFIGHCVQAIELYNRAVHLLDQVIGNPAFVNSQQEAEASRCAYMARIEALKHQVNDYPEVFATPSSQQFVNRNDGSITHYPQNHNPSVVDVGIGLVQLANKEGGKHIIRGMQAAANLNQQYKMTDTICNGVKSASTSTVALNEKYKIVDRLKEGATAAYTSAKQINEEHEITKVWFSTQHDIMRKSISIINFFINPVVF